MSIETPVKIHKRPELKKPFMVAGWPGMGGVAIITANYLKQKLNAEEFGEIESYGFFSPAQVLIKDHMIQTPEFPSSKFFFWDEGQEHDLIIFIGDVQPDQGYEFCNKVIDVAEEFHVERVYTSATFALFIHHSREPKVWGTATKQELIEYLGSYEVMLMEEGRIAGLNGLLLGVGKERGIEGVCLLGEMPAYATQIANPKASRAVLEVLTRMLDIEVDMRELSAWAEKMEPAIEKLYEALPEQAKDAIDKFEGMLTSMRSEELEADQELFDEIERFLHELGDKGGRG